MAGNDKPIRKDIVIHAPAATARLGVAKPLPVPEGGRFQPPTPEEMVQLQAQLLKAKDKEIEDLKIAANTITNVAVCMAKILCELGHGSPSGPNTVVIPRDLSDYMIDAKITVSENRTRDVVVKFRDKGPRLAQGD